MSVPGYILTNWRSEVPAILINLLPGEQVGNALVDIIFGLVPPQAKLPITLPNIENEQGFTQDQYNVLQSNYSEGQITGYRWYDKHGVTPAFPFGHGLTYGTFTYAGIQVVGRTVSFDITRTAGTGCDTAQVYLSYPDAKADPAVPVKVLRFFHKTCEQNTVVSYEFTDKDVSNWDVGTKQWTVTKGTYNVSVGSSSRDIRLNAVLVVT